MIDFHKIFLANLIPVRFFKIIANYLVVLEFRECQVIDNHKMEVPTKFLPNLSYGYFFRARPAAHLNFGQTKSRA